MNVDFSVELTCVRCTSVVGSVSVCACRRHESILCSGVCVCVLQSSADLSLLNRIYYSVYQSIENPLYFIKSNYDLCMSQRLLRENMYSTKSYMNY